jgi:hypothetical protein
MLLLQHHSEVPAHIKCEKFKKVFAVQFLHTHIHTYIHTYIHGHTVRTTVYMDRFLYRSSTSKFYCSQHVVVMRYLYANLDAALHTIQHCIALHYYHLCFHSAQIIMEDYEHMMNDINTSVTVKHGDDVIDCGVKDNDNQCGVVSGSESLRFHHKRDILELMSIGWPSR